MVVKKKAPRVEAVVLDSAELKSLTTSLSVDGREDSKELAMVLKLCLTSGDPVLQVQLVSKAGSMLEHMAEAECSPDQLLLTCLDALAVIYTHPLQAKNPLRRAVASALGNVPDWLQERAVCCLSEHLSMSLSSLSSEYYTHLMDCITSCLDSFPIGEKCVHHLVTEVLQFFRKVVCEYLEQNRGLAGRHVAQAQLMQSCLAVVKASMLVVQRSQELIGAAELKTSSNSGLQQAFGGLLRCYAQILTDEEFVQAVQSTAGMAVVLLIKSVMGNGDCVTTMVADLLQCIQQEEDRGPQWLKESCAGLYVRSRPAALALYLSHGALAMLNWRGRTLCLQEEKLLLLIPDVILSLDASVKETSTAMVVSRVLSLWSSAALDCLHAKPRPSLLCRSLRGECPLPSRLLCHVYAHWEHPLDGVRHQTRILFRNLLALHQHCGDPAADPTSDPYIVQLTHSLLTLDWHTKGKYGSLACLAEHLGAEYLLQLDASLPSRLLSLMGDQMLATYCSELLERLFVSHKGQLCARFRDDQGWMDDWHKTWVNPLLEVLCTARLEQTTYILDYFLPKLLRCNPASLRCMMQALQDMPSSADGPVGSRGVLGALMTCLRAARAQGVLKPADEKLWGTMVPFPVLKQALVHKHDQVRVDALGLVCESHRSTETLSTQEMDLICHYLPSNLNSQSPGVRQQTVSLFKKLLCRMKESTQALQRKLAQERDEQQKARDQHVLSTYQKFLYWFCESLFQVLQPGASFSICLVTLQLLGLVADQFSFSSEPESFALGARVSVPHAQAVLYCLSSNFLEVKQLACTLLRKLPPNIVGLQEAVRLQCMLQAALDLSTSTKPFDSVTAAHLLNLLLHQEALHQVLLHYAHERGVPLQLPDFTQASEVSILEKNTLAVVLYLMTCLKTEVAQAETSLLLAAASCPLYGRAHCIAAALQQLSTGSLQLQAEWSQVVSDLIALCYRMSEVVSPIVQSSSPEGLIPMDTDSETSSCLQKILQEIQPRDTNDFFSTPRELDATSEEQRHTPQVASTGSDRESYRVTAQMVLVCCWRSMKEVSMLLGELCQSMPLCTHTCNGLITKHQVTSNRWRRLNTEYGSTSEDEFGSNRNSPKAGRLRPSATLRTGRLNNSGGVTAGPGSVTVKHRMREQEEYIRDWTAHSEEIARISQDLAKDLAILAREIHDVAGEIDSVSSSGTAPSTTVSTAATTPGSAIDTREELVERVFDESLNFRKIPPVVQTKTPEMNGRSVELRPRAPDSLDPQNALRRRTWNRDEVRPAVLDSLMLTSVSQLSSKIRQSVDKTAGKIKILFKDKDRNWDDIESKLSSDSDIPLLKTTNKEISTILTELKRVEKQIQAINIMVDPDGTLDALTSLALASPTTPKPKASNGASKPASTISPKRELPSPGLGRPQASGEASTVTNK